MLIRYIAKNKKGIIKKGFFAPDEKMQVYESLKNGGFVIVSQKAIREKKKILEKFNSLFNRFSMVNLEDKMFFTRQLSVMVSAGISLPKSLEILKNQARTSNFRNIINLLAENVKRGKTLAQSLENYSAIFGEFFVNMVKAGEEGGGLDSVLKLLAKHLERENSIRKKVKGAMIYPAIIFAAMLAIAILMMAFFVPKLASTFHGLDLRLPLATQILINISLWLETNFIKFIVCVVIAAFAVKILLAFNFGKKLGYFLALRSPVFGKASRKTNSGRFARVMSLLMKGGVSVAESLKITAGTFSNIYYKDALFKISKDVQEGKTFYESLEKFSFIFPPIIAQMVKIGEETGASCELLSKIADFFEEDVDNTVKNITSVIEPVLMIIISLAIAFFAASMLMPMYSMINIL